MTVFAYHATNSTNLARIGQEGILAQEQPEKHGDEDREFVGRAVYFSVTEELAAVWGDAVIRFPWPEEATPDWYSDTVRLADGEILASNWFCRTDVSPSDLQVKVGLAWVGWGKALRDEQQVL
jgi:hypothetical protein